MRTDLLALTLVTATVACLFRPAASPSQPHTSLNQVWPGMPKAEVLQRLGPPDCQGDLKVVDGTGSYFEYGSAHLTWEGRPTITFHPDGRVLAVIGSELRLAQGSAPIRLGQPALEVPHQVDSGTLTVTTARSGVISRMVLSEKS